MKDLKEHDVVTLIEKHDGVAKGSIGTIVSLYSSTKSVVVVEFDGCHVIDVPSRFLSSKIKLDLNHEM